MEQLNSITELLNRISSSKEDTFVYDEIGIQEECLKEEEQSSSLVIKILSVLGGIMATLAFVAFVFLTSLIDSKVGMVVFGIAGIITAFGLDRAFDKLIIDTSSIAAYIVGLCLLFFGLEKFDIDDSLLFILVAIVAIIGLFFSQNFMLSFISVLVISFCSFGLIVANTQFEFLHLYNIIMTATLTYVFLNEATIISYHTKLAKLYNPLRIALIFSLLLGLTFLWGGWIFPLSEHHIWISSTIMIVVIIYLVERLILITEIEHRIQKFWIYVLTALVLGATFFSPAISGALVIILLSFYVDYKTGLVIGILALIFFVSRYYYDLNLTLLTKSILMFGSGLVFLLFYFLTDKIFKAE